MPRFTDEQVEAARMALPAFSFPTPSQMRAALTAAADAAPAVDTTEFEQAIREFERRQYRQYDATFYEHSIVDPQQSRADLDAARQCLLDMYREAAR